MSADNFYLVTTHPTSGFAVLMGFASNEDEVLTASEKDKSYPTLKEAVDYATSEYSEYGVEVSNEAVELDKMLSSQIIQDASLFAPSLCQHEGEPEYDRQECRYGDGHKHTKCAKCGYAFDGCVVGYQLALKQERYKGKVSVVELINKYHEENHIKKHPALSIGSNGAEFNTGCSCKAIKELIVLSLVDEAVLASENANEDNLSSNQAVADATIGLSEEEALALLGKANLLVRVTERNGAFYPVTRDYILERVNLSIKGSVVYKATLG